ncbi:FHS family L-fucose permease-like MFS transporter [Pelomonas saccharophila]|uniref:FHS family L-fucose permease-like MFS transporter n=1 Tax=Roseateles saccharophilus TaxID=304 RepID=A0ABU1YKN6_ROSSA|nr:sugar MFS transporter [Roseateles saccharophilus]MDR7269429.1 FHS family L-fucose permease-like MFS transporter [Roseateles saccharophilus]
MSVPASALPVQQESSRAPLAIVTLLFFMWGLLTALNDVLIPHLKALYTLSYLQAMLVQFCFFGAYFLVSLPAGRLIQRLGYQRGAVAGLAVAAAGCLLFLPAASAGYALFLFAFFVLAAGITVLQVAANPYVAALGDPRTASSRLTLTQAFNSLGTAVAPALGVLILPAGASGSVQGPYLALAAALSMLAFFFALARLPRIADEATPTTLSAVEVARSHPHLLWGVVAIFLYVGAEVSIGSLLINFMQEAAGLSAAAAAPYLSLYWGGAMVGRFVGVGLMRLMAPGRLLAVHAALAVALIVVGATTHGLIAMWALLAVGLCNSIMFPTIFSMAVHRLGAQTAQGSGLLCMAIVGGALLPLLQGHAADVIGLQASFGVPALCYAGIAAYGWLNARLFD